MYIVHAIYNELSALYSSKLFTINTISTEACTRRTDTVNVMMRIVIEAPNESHAPLCLIAHDTN